MLRTKPYITNTYNELSGSTEKHDKTEYFFPPLFFVLRFLLGSLNFIILVSKNEDPVLKHLGNTALPALQAIKSL